MTPFDLLRLDRDVAAISARLRAWRRAGRIEEPPAIPRELGSLATYRDLKDLDSDPIAGRLALHVASLTIDRVTVDDEVRVSEARRARSESPAAPGVSARSTFGMVPAMAPASRVWITERRFMVFIASGW